MTSDDWHWRVQSKCLHETPLEIFHLKCVLESTRTIWITKDLVEFLNNFILYILVDTHHGQEETATSRSSIVTLKHDGVNLLFNFFIWDNNSTLRAFEKQVEESKAFLLSNVIFVIQIILKSSRLTERETFDRRKLVGNSFCSVCLSQVSWFVATL